MRIIYTLIFFVLVGITSTFAQSDKQYTLVTKKTADWCTRCGSWGWTFVKDGLVEWEDSNVLFWAMHYSGGLANPTAQEVVDNFPNPGQPVFTLNQDNLNVSSSNYQAKIEEAKLTIDALGGFPAIIQVGVEPIIDADNNISATATVKFTEGSESDYNVSLFLIRDSLKANQAGGPGANALHPNILSESLMDETFGPVINSGGSIMAGDEFTFTGTLNNVTPHTNNITNMKVAAVVWYKVGDEYTFINGDIQSVQMTSSAKDISTLDFEYSIVGNTINIELANENADDLQFALYGINGASMPINNIDRNGNRMSVTTDGLIPGVYVMSLNNGSTITSRQIYIVE